MSPVDPEPVEGSPHPEPVEGPAHPEHVEGRELPDFLTLGDPALTFPHGKRFTPLHPKGLPITPPPPTPADTVREWLEHVAAGRIGGDIAKAV